MGHFLKYQGLIGLCAIALLLGGCSHQSSSTTSSAGNQAQSSPSTSKVVTNAAKIPVTSSVSPQDASLAMGKQLFDTNCAVCHGQHGEGKPAMLQGHKVRFDNPNFQKKLTDQKIKQTIRTGKGIMPSFASTFNEKQLNELVKYVRSLGQKSS